METQEQQEPEPEPQVQILKPGLFFYIRNIIGFICLIALFVLAFYADTLRYGQEISFKKGELFYKSPVTEEEAKNLGNFFVKTGYFNNEEGVSVQVIKTDDTYTIRFVTQDIAFYKNQYHLYYRMICGEVAQSVFPDHSVVVNLCDEQLETQKVLTPLFKMQRNQCAVYWSTPVTEKVAQDLLESLVSLKYFQDDNNADVELQKQDGVYRIMFIVQSTIVEDPEYQEAFISIATEIRDKIFPGLKIEAHLCDEYFQSQKKIDIP